jgi:hypothetical protein
VIKWRGLCYQLSFEEQGGEYFTAFLLSARWDLDVVIADSEGFDLLVRDPKGQFPGKPLKAISVKSRVQSNDKSLTFQIQNSYHSLRQAAKKWHADPYFAFLAYHRFEAGGRIHFMLVRACPENSNLFGPRTFEFRVARKMKSNENFRYFVLPVQQVCK